MSRNTAVLIAVMAAFFISIPWVGLKDFYTRGEPREAIVAQSMLDGQWLTGEGYGGAVPSKPPFTHWLAALFSLPSGEVSEFTARLPSALSFCVFAGIFVWMLSAHVSVERALLSSLMLSSCIEWNRAALTTRVDMVLSAAIAAGLLFCIEWQRLRKLGLAVCAVLLFSAAVLTKGPVAMVLPGAVFGVFLLFQQASFGRAFLQGVQIFLPVLLLAGLWYAAALLGGGEAFKDKFWEENIARFSGTMQEEAHDHTVFYLYGTLLLGLFPWVLMLVPEIPRLWRMDFWKSLRSKWNSSLPLEKLSLLTLFFFLLFFSIPASKRSVYLLPAYPFACFLLSGVALGLYEDGREAGLKLVRNVTDFVAVILACAGVLLLIAGFAGPEWLSGLEIRGSAGFYLRELFGMVGTDPSAVLMLLLPATVPLFRGKYPVFLKPLNSALATLFILHLSLNSGLIPNLANAVSPRGFAAEISPLIGEGAKVYSFGNEFYGLSFYLGRRIDRFKNDLKAGDFIVLYDENLKLLEAEVPAGLVIRQLAVSARGVEHWRKKLLLMQVGYPADQIEHSRAYLSLEDS